MLRFRVSIFADTFSVLLGTILAIILVCSRCVCIVGRYFKQHRQLTVEIHKLLLLF
jgi:hypothetical protein